MTVRLRDVSSHYHDLVARYAKLWHAKDPLSVRMHALATRSQFAVDVLAHMASAGLMRFSDIVKLTDFRALNQLWLAELAVIVHRNPSLDDYLPFALSALKQIDIDGVSDQPIDYLRSRAELALNSGDFEYLSRSLRTDQRISSFDRNYIELNMVNPHRDDSQGDSGRWGEIWAAFFAFDQLPAPIVDVANDISAPFDRLTSPQVPAAGVDGPLVTVIMTAFNPEEAALLTSVKSILAQSWQNIEIILVDDASSEDKAAVIQRVGSIDPRISIVTARVNRGTYVARNLGITAANGTIITGQDADDWAHPLRIERQLEPIIAGEARASTSRSVRTYDDLSVLTNRGSVTVINESSLMFLKEDAERLGNYLPIRKGGDSEFRLRIAAAHGKKPAAVEQVLSIVRSTPGSLSTSDFAVGWFHPARLSYRHAFTYWHATTPPEDLVVGDTETLPFPVPQYISSKHSDSRTYDVVFAGTWMKPSSRPDPAVLLAEELSKSGLQVGLMNLHSPDDLSFVSGKGTRVAMRALAAGSVDEVLTTDRHTIQNLVITDPRLLLPLEREAIALEVERGYILANREPNEADHTNDEPGFYAGVASTRMAELIRAPFSWIATNTQVRATLQEVVTDHEVEDMVLGEPRRSTRYWTARTGFRSDRPIIGRFAGADRDKWPSDMAEFHSAYPDSPEVEIRTCGRIPRLLRGAVVGQKDNWLTFQYDEIPVAAFLNSLDFYVNFDQGIARHDTRDEIQRALCFGLVVILPEHYREYFGDAALYCRPQQVQDLVLDLYGDPQQYFAQSERAIRHSIEHYSPEAAATRLLNIIGHKSAGKP